MFHVLLSDLWEKGKKEEERIREGGKEGLEKECKEGRKEEGIKEDRRQDKKKEF